MVVGTLERPERHSHLCPVGTQERGNDTIKINLLLLLTLR